MKCSDKQELRRKNIELTKRKYKTHLVIGDAHSSPKVSNRRFDWLANFIEDKRPDVIVDIGDWGDFDSIGKYNKGNKSSWGQSYKRDVDCFLDASKRAFGRIVSIKGYSPRIERLGGNHEEGRINKCIDANPELDGTIKIDDLKLREHGAFYTPFLKVKIIDGIAYSHYFYDKDSRYALGSARQVLNKKHQSSSWGHSHLFDYAEGTKGDGTRISALNVGCFLDPNQSMGYAGPQARDRWRSGLVLKHGVNQGQYDLEWYSIERIQREYS